MKQTYNSINLKNYSKPKITAKKGSKEWFINKYGKNKGEEQYYLSMALKANEKVRTEEMKNKSTIKTTKQLSPKLARSTTKKPSTPKKKLSKNRCKR